MTIDIDYYYKESSWTVAFSGNSSKVIIASSGAVYKDSITPFNLVNDQNGVDGFAGQPKQDDITLYVNSDNGDAVAAQIKSENDSLIISGGDFTLNEWIHAAISYQVSDNSLKLYVNGELVSSDTLADTIQPFVSIRDAILGRSNNLFLEDFNFTGNLDDFRVYDSVLTEQNIKDVYDWGNQSLQFEKLRFVVPKGYERGRSSIFKFASDDYMQIRNLGIEYNNTRIR